MYGTNLLGSCKTHHLFSLIATFYFAKTETESKNFYPSSETIALSKATILTKKTNFLQKMPRSAILRGPWC